MEKSTKMRAKRGKRRRHEKKYNKMDAEARSHDKKLHPEIERTPTEKDDEKEAGNDFFFKIKLKISSRQY